MKKKKIKYKGLDSFHPVYGFFESGKIYEFSEEIVKNFLLDSENWEDFEEKEEKKEVKKNGRH